MIVYRIEYKNTGEGPYNANGISWNDWGKRSHDNPKRTPCPKQDFNIDDYSTFDKSKKYLCAFQSIKQLKQWFNQSEIKRMERLGCQVYKIKIDGRSKIIKGKKQLAFNKKYIKQKSPIRI